jgi:hypothetical protein
VRLLDQVRHAARVKHCSYRTELAYVSWAERYIRFHYIRHPNTMGAAEVEQFLTCAPYDDLAGFGRKTRSGIPRSGWSGDVETAPEDDGQGNTDCPSIPSDRTCSAARCHASAWVAARASMAFSPLVSVTSHMGPSAVSSSTSPTLQPAA